MSVTTSKLPRRLAIAGVAIPAAFAAMWWFVGKYNVFHEPTTWQQVREMGSYSEPLMRSFLEDVTLALCPGEFLEIVAMDWSGFWGLLFIWIVAAVINGVLYYWLGRGIVALMKRVRRPGTH